MNRKNKFLKIEGAGKFIKISLASATLIIMFAVFSEYCYHPNLSIVDLLVQAIIGVAFLMGLLAITAFIALVFVYLIAKILND